MAMCIWYRFWDGNYTILLVFNWWSERSASIYFTSVRVILLQIEALCRFQENYDFFEK